jgi:predicted ATP-dependent protease
MANTFDYYQNAKILNEINRNIRFIKNQHDKEDCRQEVFAELYNEMPISESEAIKLVSRIARKFKRDNAKIACSETGLAEAYID